MLPSDMESDGGEGARAWVGVRAEVEKCASGVGGGVVCCWPLRAPALGHVRDVDGAIKKSLTFKGARTLG